MLATFLKAFGKALGVAALTAVAMVFGNPESYAALGQLAVVAAAVGAAIALAIGKLVDKLRQP